MKKRALVALALGAVIFAGLIAVRSWRFGISLLHPPRVAVPAAPRLEGLEEVAFADPSGATLRGWWVPSKNRAAIVLLHGHGGNRAQLEPELQVLARHGYGVLAFDLPGHGSSEGELVTWGDREQASLAAALGFVSTRPGVDPQRLGALGFSMGAAVVVEVAAVDPRLKAVAITGAYTTLTEALDFDGRRWGPLSQVPIRLAVRSSGVDLDRVHPIDVICRIAPRPLLLIEGGADQSNPPGMEQRLFDAACQPKSHWVVPGAGHGEYAAAGGAQYEQRMVSLFDGALLK
ncbi:MAG: hypothetical protein H6Q89_272 [Myxococcaceae bacterium]|nr:hypothetical protein [Myxococcaceae bacterium]